MSLFQCLIEAYDSEIPKEYFTKLISKVDDSPEYKFADEIYDKKQYWDSKERSPNKELTSYTESPRHNIYLNNFKNNISISDHGKKIIKQLQDAISNKEIDEHTLYTGLSGKMNTGIVHIPGFLSTSIDPKIAAGFSKNDLDEYKRMIRIKTKPNQKMEYLEPITGDISKAEHEVLLPANNVLHISHEYKEYNHNNKKLRVHDAHIMTPEEIEAHEDHPEVQSHLRIKKELGI